MPSGSVTVHEVAVTKSPVVILVEFSIMSAPEVPQFPWMITTPAFDLARKWPAVPVATAVADVIAFANAVASPFVPPSVEAANAVALRVRVARRVPLSAVSVVASGAPVRISTVPAPPVNLAVMASRAARAASMEMIGAAAIVVSYEVQNRRLPEPGADALYIRNPWPRPERRVVVVVVLLLLAFMVCDIPESLVVMPATEVTDPRND